MRNITEERTTTRKILPGLIAEYIWGIDRSTYDNEIFELILVIKQMVDKVHCRGKYVISV